MLIANNKFHKLVFKHKAYRREMEYSLRLLLEEGVRVWLQAALTAVDGEFPVWTGMSIATFEPIAAKVKFNMPHYQPEKVRKNQSPALGREAGKLCSVNVYTNPAGAFRFDFQWTTLVPHFIENEFQGPPHIDPVTGKEIRLKHDTPWGAIDKANDEFANFINLNLESMMPDITKFIVSTERTTV